MRNHIANFAAAFGKRLAWWFVVAWNLMFGLWIAAGGLAVEGTYLVAEARSATLPIILVWAVVNVVVLIGWHTVTTRRRCP